jgi:PAS domain S-box-containing protein
MKPSPTRRSLAALRAAAEAKLREMPAARPAASEADVTKAHPGLVIHEVELETQDEALCAAWADLEASLNRYTDLYDGAPVSYFNLDASGGIQLVNLTGAKWLGVDRAQLTGRDFASFVVAAHRPAFHNLLDRVFATGVRQVCELDMVGQGAQPMTARLKAMLAPAGGECFLALMDITERKQAEESLRFSEHLLNEAQALAHLGSWQLVFGAGDAHWTGSAELHRIYGYPPDKTLTLETGFDHMHPDDRDRVRNIWEAFLRGEIPGRWEHRIVVEGKTKWLQVAAQRHFDPDGRMSRVTGTAMDITAIKQGETYDAMDREILQIFNEPGDLKAAIHRALAVLKQRTAFDAVGLRLQSGADFPYFVQAGFSAEFLRTENSLLERSAEGEICRDKDGKPALECTCGLVLSGHSDPANPLFTPGGSFWTNDSAPLLHLPAEADPRRHPRNQCILQGYQSVALVPIRGNNRILGLLQFNDRNKDCFTLKTVEQLEEIAAHIGVALLRKQAESALLEKQELLAETERIGQVGGWEFDIATGKLTWTQAVYDIHEVPYDYQPTVEQGINFYSPASRPVIERAVRRAIELGETFDVELEIITAKGNLRSVHAIGHADLARGRVFGFFQDITERKQAEAINTRLAAIVESSRDAIIGKDLNGIIQSWNKGAEKIFGYVADEIVGASIRKLIPMDRQQEEDRILQRVLQGESVEHYETIRQSKDGRLIPISITVSPIRDHAGKIIGASKVARDITERKHFENQMMVQSSALTAAANAIVITDRHGKVEWVNPAFTKLTGYTATEAMGQYPRLLKSGQHPPAFYANLWATILTGNVWHGEIINRHKDGQLFTEEMTITPVRDADGSITHFVAIKQDVTERRQLENRMQQAQKMEAIGTLAGGIAHDFNNILSAMLGYAYLLHQDTTGNAESQENVEEILKAADRAKDLVRQILTFSRQHEHNPQVVKLDIVVKEAFKFLRASLPAQIKIEMNLDVAAPPVLADATQIYQVIMNLATNALHAMEGRPGRLNVNLEPFLPDAAFIASHPELKPVEYARLSVADTGHGMDPETMQHIFEPFFTTKPVGKGTGLGLSVVLGIVQSHGGLITMESQVGRGTTFFLYFPGHHQAAAPTGVATDAPPEGHGQSILVVDDEPALTTVLQQMLARLKYRVAISNLGSDAIDRCSANPAQFDLVITDLTMPEMNGLEVARQLHTFRPDLPVILMSGYIGDYNEENLKAVGISELLQKPVAPTALAKAIQRILAKPV